MAGSNERYGSTIAIAGADSSKLLFELSAFRLTGPEGKNANIGDIPPSEAAIDGNEAVFTDGSFRMKLKLTGREMQVATEGGPYFGAGVVVDGMYTWRKLENIDQQAAKEFLNRNSLCTSTEEEYFGFTAAGSGKRMSVCVSAEQDYIVYRYGKRDKVELEYPPRLDDAWESFRYGYYFRGGGEQNAGQDLNELSFENGEYIYAVYDEYEAAGGETRVGITVTNRTTGKKTAIEGLPETKTGSLAKLGGSKVKEVPYSQ